LFLEPEATSMSVQPVSTAALRAAIEGRDARALLEFYRPDAVLRIIDRDHPPSRPTELVGLAAIGGYFADTCGRDMTHRVDDVVTDGDRMAFSQTCTYPTGERVACQATLHLAGGAIARQTMLVVWDA
jgi:ketosteroid isomerase-like protein